jgi:glycerol-3-phosphate acyltransferase PlsY
LGLLSFGIFVVILLITRYVSISSTICMFMPAFSVFLVGMDYFYLFDHSLLFQTSFEPDIVERVIFMVMILCNSLIVIIRHIPNIIRLSKHEEKKVFHGKV